MLVSSAILLEEARYMQPTDLTIEILKGIRDEVKGVRDEVNGVRNEVNGLGDEVRTTNARLGETNEHLDRLERRHVETKVRLATELVAVTNAVRDVRDLLRDNLALSDRVLDHERRIAAIEGRAV